MYRGGLQLCSPLLALFPIPFVGLPLTLALFWPFSQGVSTKDLMREQVAVRGSQLKVKYLYEDSTYNRKVNCIATATATPQSNGTAVHVSTKPVAVSGLSKERSVDRYEGLFTPG